MTPRTVLLGRDGGGLSARRLRSRSTPSRALPVGPWLITATSLTAEADQELTTTLTLLEGTAAQESWLTSGAAPSGRAARRAAALSGHRDARPILGRRGRRGCRRPAGATDSAIALFNGLRKIIKDSGVRSRLATVPIDRIRGDGVLPPAHLPPPSLYERRQHIHDRAATVSCGLANDAITRHLNSLAVLPTLLRDRIPLE